MGKLKLEIKNIKIYKQERKIKISFNYQQWVIIQPFGEQTVINTSELILKNDVRYLAKKANDLDYMRTHKERIIPVLYEIVAAEKEMKRFIGNVIESI